MPNIIDYLDWRGDISLKHSPFNEVDNLILSQLVYANLEYIVPSRWSGASITLKEASENYFAVYSEEEIAKISYVNRISVPLLRKLGQCPRFANAKLSKFEKITDLDRVKQFAAMVVELDDDSVFYAYRGTDNSIVGWKENFNMCLTTPIAAQYEALRYLEDTVGEGDAPLRLGGHSKGGNLAIYAAMMCRPAIKERILQVYNNDGPGFDGKIIKSAPYQQILDRIITIIPQSSVVGMLLEHEEAYTIVQSNAPLLMQHEAFSWEVMGNAFVKGESVEKKSELLDITLKSWLGQLDKMQRQQFVSAVFHVFDAGDIRTFEDLGRAKWAKISEMITALNQSPQYKAILIKMLRLLLREGRKAIMSAKKKKTKSDPGGIYFLE
ncbi:hypothetical protein A7K91_20140 [Paenibacillus oryzae]|uniref:DUF2974 domain-containing protein n=1 Tax=Paenibacillus oryzae TaxID=1844972 RepID=A0A1A5YI88_9BACL|nr:Mbeg1-like protein [Paenibacillus oryzae]OBR65294.1 hypothetical protein A7K91_20140 [Paenibacillus oryzae]